MTDRLRQRLATLFVVLAALALLVSEVAVWADAAIFDSDGFASRSEAALADEDVRAFLTTQIVDVAIEEGSADLVTARPLLEAAVDATLGSAAFREIYVTAIRSAHGALFTEEPIVLELFDAMLFVRATVEGLDPDLADRLPEIDDALIEISEQRELDALRGAADRAEVNAVVWPAITLLLAAVALGLATDRRRAAIRLGVAAALTAGLAIVALEVGRAALVATADSEQVRGAIDGTWHAFLDDLHRWNLVLGGVSVAFAAAATSTMPRFDLGADVARVRALVLRDSGWMRWGRAVVAVWLGILALTEPDQIVGAVIVLAGLYLLYAGLTELFRLLGLNAIVAPDDDTSARTARVPAPLRIAAFAAIFLAGTSLAAGIVGGLGPFDRGADSPFEVVDTTTCNGHAELCDRRVDQVTLAATHNSMSAVADGWLFASHSGGVAAQLEAGVRGLLIDVWHGFQTDNGVRTELLTGDRDQLIEEYGLELVEARDRIAATLGVEGRRDLFLCHGFCELGATPFADTLADIRRFIVTHPRDVVVLVIQDEAPPGAIATAIADADLVRYAYTHPEPAAPWPTLGELIDSGRTLIVMAEGGATPEPWFHAAYALAQETPYAFTSPDDLSCAPNRGEADAQLFLVNHWIEDITPSPGDAAVLNARDVLLPRLRECAAERGLTPNLVAVNFYLEGDLFEVIDELNGVVTPTD